jgi:hypothetical protein
MALKATGYRVKRQLRHTLFHRHALYPANNRGPGTSLGTSANSRTYAMRRDQR